MSKRNNISYIKPQDPSFLAKLKAQIGYKEGPTVDTKRQRIEEDGDSDTAVEERPEREDEKPQIVVLRSGDLTADEVAKEEQRIAEEEAVKPADLNQPIVFQKRKSKKSASSVSAAGETVEKTSTSSPSSSSSSLSKEKKTKKSKPSNKCKLSFNEDEEDEAAN